ncbi:hypothetical protein GCM10010873_19740 [Cypionkella aquatica]|uniref:Uncharacterized protein n=1 Tax=Cypionkella aquatica TaxID=1756042 RepID=A0AA37TW20_9RHOB|nr:hypothetical protein [Cypionkella aquatica]GLS87000.1 hypothetical protein GCM10010873_19740 [Cypionkella aquatica]
MREDGEKVNSRRGRTGSQSRQLREIVPVLSALACFAIISSQLFAWVKNNGNFEARRIFLQIHNDGEEEVWGSLSDVNFPVALAQSSTGSRTGARGSVAMARGGHDGFASKQVNERTRVYYRPHVSS